MALEDILFWKYLEIVLQSLVALVWGWGVLFTLAKIPKYRNMIVGTIGCLGMFLVTLGQILQQLPYTVVVCAGRLDAVYQYNHLFYTFLSQPYRWEGLQILLLICLVAALAGRSREPLKLVAEIPVKPAAEMPVKRPKVAQEPSRKFVVEPEKPIAEMVSEQADALDKTVVEEYEQDIVEPEDKTPETEPPAEDDEARAIRNEETLYDYRVIKEFQEREPEDFTVAMLDKKTPGQALQDLQNEDHLLQRPEEEMEPEIPRHAPVFPPISQEDKETPAASEPPRETEEREIEEELDQQEAEEREIEKELARQEAEEREREEAEEREIEEELDQQEAEEREREEAEEREIEEELDQQEAEEREREEVEEREIEEELDQQEAEEVEEREKEPPREEVEEPVQDKAKTKYDALDIPGEYDAVCEKDLAEKTVEEETPEIEEPAPKKPRGKQKAEEGEYVQPIPEKTAEDKTAKKVFESKPKFNFPKKAKLDFKVHSTGKKSEDIEEAEEGEEEEGSLLKKLIPEAKEKSSIKPFSIKKLTPPKKKKDEDEEDEE